MQHDDKFDYKSKSTIQCEGCQLIIGAMKDWLADNTTITAIEHYLDWVCYLVPHYNTTCNYIIETGVPILIKFIEKYEKPETVCAQLGLCTWSDVSKLYTELKSRSTDNFIKFF
jgi:hypothetical protein